MDDCDYCKWYDVRETTYTCHSCHTRKTCEICGDRLNGKGFVSPCCHPVENRCIKRCVNCPPFTEGLETWCKDCIAYSTWSQVDDKSGPNDRFPLSRLLEQSQKDAFEKISNLKESIQEGKVFKVEGKSYIAYEAIGEFVKGSDD